MKIIERLAQIRINGKTVANSRFIESIRRVEMLIDTGLSGIETRKNSLEQVLAKIPAQENFDFINDVDSSDIDIKRKGEVFEVTMSNGAAQLIRSALTSEYQSYDPLHTYLNSILAVYTWGTFETYILMVFEEVYRKKPDCLKSTKKFITFQEAIERQENLVDVIIEKEIDKIGHFKIKELFKYLEEKLSLEFTGEEKKILSEYYFVRNIIAHNTGIIRPEIRNKVPDSVSVVDNEIQISDEFLLNMINLLISVEQKIEDIVIEKFL